MALFNLVRDWAARQGVTQAQFSLAWLLAQKPVHRPDPRHDRPSSPGREPRCDQRQEACRKCHAAVVAAIDPTPGHRPSDKTSCIRCHSTVGHMR